MRWNRIQSAVAASALGALVMLVGCERNDMHNQPREEAYEASDFFADGKSARPIIQGTVAVGSLHDKRLIEAATDDNNTFPFEITAADMKRGQERFNIYCMPCHGGLGEGDGMIVRRGFTKPPSFHEERLRNANVGHFVNVMTNGYGAMYSYNDRISAEDRWKIAAYIRALQLSQNADQSMLAPVVAATTDAEPKSHEGH